MGATHDKGCRGMGMEGWIARWYARTRRNDLGDFRRQAQAVAELLPKGARVLEVAPGPGFFAVELRKLGDFGITGLDLSRTFVGIARDHARQSGVEIEFCQGNASAMPFPDESFDFVYCAAAFKNFSQPVKALDEMHRVLRPEGSALIADLRKDVSLVEIEAYVEGSGRTGFDAWMTKWAFRSMLIKRALSREDFCRLAAQSRFGECQFRVSADPLTLEVHLARQATVPAAR